MSHLIVLFSSCSAAIRTVQRVVDREELTPVQVMICWVWLLCLHDCYHPIYPATHHRQIRHHDRTTVHFVNAILLSETLIRRSSLRPANGPLPSLNQREESGLASLLSRLETMKGTAETSILCRWLFRFPQPHFLFKDSHFYLFWERKKRVPGQVALKTVCQRLRP